MSACFIVVASGQGVAHQAVRREQEPGGAQPAAPAVPARPRRHRAPRRGARVRAVEGRQGQAHRGLHLGVGRRTYTQF